MCSSQLCVFLMMMMASASHQTEFEKMKKAVNEFLLLIGEQTMNQQLFVEERIRSEGNSGVKQVRHLFDGKHIYDSASHTGFSFMAMHDHANNIRTVGMGEFIGVLNGVEFRTRHNDYRLFQPHATSKEWHKTQEIPFPKAPFHPGLPLNIQITLMKKLFKDWRDDEKSRKYTRFFKPVLCYLEGFWTTSTKGKIDEPFESDRHFIDAKSWFDLHQKIRFTSYAGRKTNFENLSFLPTKIMNVTVNGYPKLILAQWNYRIMCHPLKQTVPLTAFEVVDEVGIRMRRNHTLKQHTMERTARFKLKYDGPVHQQWSLIDKLMSEIPGLDNYQAKLTDDAFDLSAYPQDPKTRYSRKKLNAGYYHRRFRVGWKGAGGEQLRNRGFSDLNLYMAMNTQDKVAGMELEHCSRSHTWPFKKVCKTIIQKWSYAIPLEIIYLTPLNTWNPHNIPHRFQDKQRVEGKGLNRRDGRTRPFDGTHDTLFYRTPVEFFSGKEVGTSNADTTGGIMRVLGAGRREHKCVASGTRIILPNIKDVGVLRQRFPIAPLHGEGNAAWKELEALKDAVLDSNTNAFVFREPLQGLCDCAEKPKTKKISSKSFKVEQPINPPAHEHNITLSIDQVKHLTGGKRGGLFPHIKNIDTDDNKHKVTLIGINDDIFIVVCDRRIWKRTRHRNSIIMVACSHNHPSKLIPF